MLLLFAISGICNVASVFATDSINIPPTSVFYMQYYLYEGETLEITVDSSDTINVYLMNNDQFISTKSSGYTTWEYTMRWKDIWYLYREFDIVVSDVYYIVFYNKGLIYERYVEYDINVVPSTNVFFFVIIPIAVIGVVIIGYVIFKKKSPKEPIIQMREVPKITYCSECGAEVSDKRMFCSNCGSNTYDQSSGVHHN